MDGLDRRSDPWPLPSDGITQTDCTRLFARLQLAQAFEACCHGSAMSPSSEAERDLEHLVFEIAKGVSAETGEAFFRSLVLHLARALHADYVFVGALQRTRRVSPLLRCMGRSAKRRASRTKWLRRLARTNRCNGRALLS